MVDHPGSGSDEGDRDSQIGRLSLPTGNEVDIKVGSRVRMRREELSISLEKLSADCDISEALLTCYERGEVRFAAHRLFLLSKLLQVDIGYFFSDL